MIVGQSLYGICIQDLIKKIILKQEPHLLENSSKFYMTYKWTLGFIKTEINWSYRVATRRRRSRRRKLPLDYEEQGKKMIKRCAYLVKISTI